MSGIGKSAVVLCLSAVMAHVCANAQSNDQADWQRRMLTEIIDLRADLTEYLVDAQQNRIVALKHELEHPGGPVASLMITNHSSVTVEGPIHVLLQGMTPGRSLINPDGDYLGSQFVTLTSSALAPGQWERVTLQFDGDSTTAAPSFRVRLAAGDF
jgi:hypothetical protein